MLSSRSNSDNRPVLNGNRVFQQEVTQEGLYRLFLTLYPKIQTINGYASPDKRIFLLAAYQVTHIHVPYQTEIILLFENRNKNR